MADISWRRLISLPTNPMSTMACSAILDAILYYVFHLIYLGYPSEILARLWLAHDIANRRTNVGEVLGENHAHFAWKTFDDSMRSSYRAIGTLAGLLAGAMTGLSTINNYREDITIRTLLLAGLTASVISASSCLSMLSTIHFDPANIERHWEASGIIYIIALSGPSSWLNIALWLFQASILAIVWIKESLPAKVIVTIFLGIRILFRVVAQLRNFTPADSMLVEFLRGLLGWTQGMSHKMINLNSETVKRRGRYLRKLNEHASSKEPTMEDAPIPGSVFIGMERQNIFRGKLEEPTRGDLNFEY